jgi:HSP20 family protein
MAQYRLYRPARTHPAGFDDLWREMDAVFSRFAGAPAATGARRGVFPAVNLYESADGYTLTAELPGVAPEDIEVSVERSTVAIRGERKIDYGKEAGSAHRLERQAGAFRRAFELPSEIDPDKIEAVHRNGVLLLRIPKRPEHQPRQIAVQAQ